MSLETFTHAEKELSSQQLHELCSAADILSPNEKEAISMVGDLPPEELVQRLGDAGAPVVVLRRAEKGSIVYNASTGEMWAVPAITSPHPPVDVTGCGNSYCGGFLAAWSEGEDLLTAGLWGSVAASFMMSFQGVPPPYTQHLTGEALQRLEALRPHATCLQPSRLTT